MFFRRGIELCGKLAVIECFALSSRNLFECSSMFLEDKFFLLLQKRVLLVGMPG